MCNCGQDHTGWKREDPKPDPQPPDYKAEARKFLAAHPKFWPYPGDVTPLATLLERVAGEAVRGMNQPETQEEIDQLASAREEIEQVRRDQREEVKNLVALVQEGRTLLHFVHRAHPQPEICDACKHLGRLAEPKP